MDWFFYSCYLSLFYTSVMNFLFKLKTRCKDFLNLIYFKRNHMLCCIIQLNWTVNRQLVSSYKQYFSFSLILPLKILPDAHSNKFVQKDCSVSGLDVRKIPHMWSSRAFIKLLIFGVCLPYPSTDMRFCMWMCRPVDVYKKIVGEEVLNQDKSSNQKPD